MRLNNLHKNAILIIADLFVDNGKSFSSASDAAAAVDDDYNDDDCYEYVPPVFEEATSGELPEYLDILDNNTGGECVCVCVCACVLWKCQMCSHRCYLSGFLIKHD